MNEEDARFVAVALARRAGAEARVLRVELRTGRILVELPSHVVWLALDPAGAARLAVERAVLGALAGRLPVAIPACVVHDERACLRTKVVGQSGLDHHRRVMGDPALAHHHAVDLAGLFAAVHTALTPAERAQLVAAGLPTRAPLDRDDVARAAGALDPDRRDRALALLDAQRLQVVSPADCTFVHGDLGSHNMVVDAAGSITGLFDFEESFEGDRHHEFRWMPSYGPAFLAAALDVYRRRTGAGVDVTRVRRIHALAALEQLGWGLRAPTEHVRTGRTLDETRAWAEHAVDEN